MVKDYRLVPYDPHCEQFARDMKYLDSFWATCQEELDESSDEEKSARREKYVFQEDGTFNRSNGHFLCDDCYIKEGMPSAPGGWVCP